MIRVLHLDETSDLAGLGVSIVRLVSNLDGERYTPIVACPPGPLADAVIQAGVQHIPYHFRMRRLKTGREGGNPLRIVNSLALLYKVCEGLTLARVVRQQRVDLIHSHTLSPHLAGLVAARVAGIPIIWHLHLFLPRLLYRFLLPDRLIFITRAVRQAAFPGRTPSKAIVVYYGEDFALFDPEANYSDLRVEFGLEQEQSVVAIISQLLPWKGHRDLLHAWQIVIQRFPSACLLVVGDEVDSNQLGGRYRAELEQLATDLDISNNVIFTGWRQDIPMVLNAIDVLVSASYKEALGRNILEAMAMRKAVVSTRSGGVPEVVTDGETGLLVDIGDIRGLASAIERFLADPSLRHTCGVAGREKALRMFELRQHMLRIQAVYDELINQ